jgi:nitrate/nitrite transporter NarK
VARRRAAVHRGGRDRRGAVPDLAVHHDDRGDDRLHVDLLRAAVLLAAAAAGIALINTIGNAAGFLAPYVTGWLTDLTGTSNAGMWAVGAAMTIAAIITLVLARTDKTVKAREARQTA